MSSGGDLTRVVSYIESRWRGQHAGKTLLVGFCAGQPCLAIAAGLRNEQEQPHLITLASYLLRREQADAYWLVMPHERDGEVLAMIEQQGDGQRHLAMLPLALDEDGVRCLEPLELTVDSGPLLCDLLQSAPTLPGLMRRKLDQMAEEIAVPLPAWGEEAAAGPAAS